jgi:rod shape-determining protein MreD
MRWPRFAVFILVVTTLQASIVLDWLAVTNLNIRPDLLLILVVFFAVRCSSYDAIIISFIAGLAADLIGPPIGPHIISFGLLGSMLAHIRGIVIINSTFHQVIAIFLTGLLAESLARLLACLAGSPLTANTVGIIFGTASYSAVIWLFLGWLFSASFKWISIQRNRFRTIQR